PPPSQRRHALPSVPSHPSLLSSLFLLARPPPRPTLFPYTTLFRSATLEEGAAAGAVGVHLAAAGLRVHRGRAPQARARQLHQRIDRKSTRLNSSHVKISYAVFCLKKKNKDTTDRAHDRPHEPHASP